VAVNPLGAVLELSTLKERLAGSAAERAALDAAGRWFEERGEAVRYEGFVEATSPALNAALHLFVAALGALAGTLWAPLGLLITLLALTSGALELTGRRPLLRQLLPRDTSYNVLVRRPATGRRLGTLVLAAHVDLPRRAWRFTRRLAAVSLAGGGLLAAALAVESLGVGWFWLPGLRATAGIALVLIGAMALIVHARGPRPGPGRGDSGVAAVMEASLALAERPLAHLELVIAITGSQEAHGGGVAALLRQHRHHWSPADTAFLFAEGVGGAELVYGVGEQVLTRTAYRPTLPGVAERLTRRLPWREVGWAVLDRYTGALLPTLAGYRAMVVSSTGDGGPIEAGRVRRCAAFLAEVAWQYDADQGEVPS
jgi:nitroreductase